MISWKNSLWSRWFGTSNWDSSWYSRLTYYLPFRVACIVLGILNPFDRKKYIPNKLSIFFFKFMADLKFWQWNCFSDNLSYWNRASIHFDKDGSWNFRKTCSGSRDTSCTRLRPILLVWSASVSASSHPFCFVSGFELSLLCADIRS